jgi:hypothetical protein
MRLLISKGIPKIKPFSRKSAVHLRRLLGIKMHLHVVEISTRDELINQLHSSSILQPT